MQCAPNLDVSTQEVDVSNPQCGQLASAQPGERGEPHDEPVGRVSVEFCSDSGDLVGGEERRLIVTQARLVDDGAGIGGDHAVLHCVSIQLARLQLGSRTPRP